MNRKYDRQTFFLLNFLVPMPEPQKDTRPSNIDILSIDVIDEEIMIMRIFGIAG